MSLILQDGSGNNSFSAAENGTANIVAETLPLIGNIHPGLPKFFTVTTTLTGSPTGVSVSLQGSIDGSGWFDLGNTTSISNDMFHVAHKGVEQIRAKVTTLSGGTSPTITVRVDIIG